MVQETIESVDFIIAVIKSIKLFTETIKNMNAQLTELKERVRILEEHSNSMYK